MWFLRWCCLGLTAILLGIPPVEAQIDPEKRRLIQLGYNQPLEGQGPLAGYAFYFHNEPEFIRTNLTLRLAVAPVYLDSELGIEEVLGPNTDLGLGLAGGGFAHSYFEVRRGDYRRKESFLGHGGEISSTLYHRFNPQHEIPLHGILRGGVRYSIYEEESSTAPEFELPQDRTMYHILIGLRWGGKAPRMLPALGMELSVWYDVQYRDHSTRYGFNGDRAVEPVSHLWWARALIAYTLPEWKHRFDLTMTMGTSLNTDRFSAYRIGGLLPFASDFPLNMPGYYYQELSAKNFWLLNGQYSIPLDTHNRWNLTGFAASGWMDYADGFEQPGNWHSGVGGGIAYRSPVDTWQVVLAYAYGIDAIRDHGRGAHTVGILLQYDFEARKRAEEEPFRPEVSPNQLRGFDWLFGR
jgi:hypothetical protein